jgi:hypothetical protein
MDRQGSRDDRRPWIVALATRVDAVFRVPAHVGARRTCRCQADRDGVHHRQLLECLGRMGQSHRPLFGSVVADTLRRNGHQSAVPRAVGPSGHRHCLHKRPRQPLRYRPALWCRADVRGRGIVWDAASEFEPRESGLHGGVSWSRRAVGACPAPLFCEPMA